MDATNLLEGYVDRAAIAAGFGVTPRTISRWMTLPDGLPHVTIGGRTLFRVDSVRDWLERRERRPNPRQRTAA